jgi:transcriptional regulator with XRE-family HTH domain
MILSAKELKDLSRSCVGLRPGIGCIYALRFYMTRNQRIAFAIKEAKIGQEVLGAELGISQEAVSKKLKKTKDIDSLNFLLAVCDLTGFNMSWLITGNGPQKGKSEFTRKFDEDFAREYSIAEPLPDSYKALTGPKERLNELSRLRLQVEKLKAENEAFREALRIIGGRRPAESDDEPSGHTNS